MDSRLAELVWRRARSLCEYCQLPQANSLLTFEIDHIIAVKHGGRTKATNLALSCFYCNSFKGSNIASFDPRTGKLAGLFHPRRQSWRRHFRWVGARLIGRTATARATVRVLLINLEIRVDHRRALMEAGRFPPAC